MVAPTINITSISRTKIGKVTGRDASSVTFSTNQDLVEWEARADGAGVGQGLLVGEQRTPIEDGFALKLKNPWDQTMTNYGPAWNSLGGRSWNDISYGSASFVVDNEELTWGDEDYIISIYGKNAAGEWTPFGYTNLVDNASFEDGLWPKAYSGGVYSLVTGWNGAGQAARVQVGSSGASGLISPNAFSLSAGQTIVISYMARAIRDNFAFNYRYMMSTASGNKSIGTQMISSKWDHYEQRWTVPAGETATDYKLMLSIYVGRDGVLANDWFELDDISVVIEGG